MDFWKKWLHIALTLVLTFSLIAPAAVNAEQATEEDQQAEAQAEVQVEAQAEAQAEVQVEAQVEAQLDVQIGVDGLSETIITSTNMKVAEGVNVLDVLKQALDQQKITYDIVEGSFGPYVKAINGVVAGTLGGSDGWSYTVNGKAPDVGMSAYVLKANDAVRVYYSKWPALDVEVNDRMVTVTLKGDIFTEDATKVNNWVVPKELKINAINKLSDQKVELFISGAAGSYEVKASKKALSSGQDTPLNAVLADSATQKVMDLIAALPAMYKASEVNALALKEARAAYDALTEEQKAQVSNANLLVTRENQFLESLLPKAIVIDESYRAYLTPKYSTSVQDYTLNIPTEFKTIKLQANTTHEDVIVTYAIGETKYEAGQEIPVTNNKTLTITTKLGDLEKKVNLKFKTLKPVTMKVDFRVEGIAGTTLNVSGFEIKGDGAINAAQATKQILEANNISYKYSASTDYFSVIGKDGEVGLGAGSGWVYKVNGTYPDVYSSAIELKNGDEIVWDYINSFYLVEDMAWDGEVLMASGTESVDKVTFNPIIDMPTAVKEGIDVHIKVTGKYNVVSYIYEPVSGPHIVDLANVTIELNDKKYVTDEKGEVTIPAADLAEGSHELRFTKDLPGTIFKGDLFSGFEEKKFDSFPRIIRTYKSLLVTPKELAQENRKKAEEALKLGATYLNGNKEKASARVNESHSGFWMLTAMKAVNVNAATYGWTTSPTTAGTFWATALEASQNDANKLAGTIIAAKALGLDPTNIKGRDQVADLLAMQKANGLFSTIWGEAFALIALQLTDAQYDQQKHIEAILAQQNATTGYFGDNDATGWTLFALSAFKDDPKVKAAIDKAVAAVHANYQAKGFTDNSNTMAALISGLASVGEDVFSEKWTYKNGDEYINIVSYLVDNYMQADGGVLYKAAQNQSNLMALEQVYIALADALNGKSTFYSVAENAVTPEPTKPEQPTEPGTGGGEQTPAVPTDRKVTMSITISASDVVLPSETFNITADETAFDLLKRVTQAKNIALNARQTSMGMYVAGIAGVNEFDRGKLSGWMYRVNGTFPEVSANVYKLNNGDVVEWVYTTDLGEDVGGATPPTTGGGTTTPPATEQPNKPEAKPEQTTTELTAAQLADKKEVTVTTPTGIALTIPTANATLAAGEKLAVTVEEQDGKVTFALNVVNDKGEAKPFAITKGYAKLSFSVNATNKVASADNKVKATPIAAANGDIVILQEVDGERKAVPHTIVDGEATVFTKTGGTFITATEQVTFNDIANLSNKDEITYLANRYVVKGSNGNFMPYSNITRGQFAMMIARALDLQATGKNPFTDTVGKEYEQAITALYEAGITTGRTATTFDPQGYVTRQQAASFMARILAYVEKKPTATATANYKDNAKIGATFAQDVALLAQLQIMSGKPDGSFDPHGYLTRAQMAKILKRTLNEAGLM